MVGNFNSLFNRTKSYRKVSIRLPSMEVRSCATIRRSISRWAFSRLGVIASTSSINKMHGARATACSNRSRILSSDWPESPPTSSGAATFSRGSFNSWNKLTFKIIILWMCLLHCDIVNLNTQYIFIVFGREPPKLCSNYQNYIGWWICKATGLCKLIGFFHSS